MSAQVYSVPGQTEGRSKAFLKWKSVDVPHDYLLHWDNVNYYVTIYILLVRIGYILAIFKINQ